MENIESYLQDYFTYNKELHPKGAIWLAERLDQKRDKKENPYYNIRFKNDHMGLFGIAPSAIPFEKGLWITVYSADVNMKREGGRISDKVTALKDCPYDYYGLLLNFLAYCSGEKIFRLTLSNVGLGPEKPRIYNITYRPDLVEMLFGKSKPKYDHEKNQKHYGDQAPQAHIQNQISLFA